MRRATLIISASLALAAASGFMASQALSQAEPTKTETITVRDGERGPAGPQGERGPAGPAGGTTCPDGWTLTRVIVNHPGGQLTLLACTKD